MKKYFRTLSGVSIFSNPAGFEVLVLRKVCSVYAVEVSDTAAPDNCHNDLPGNRVRCAFSSLSSRAGRFVDWTDARKIVCSRISTHGRYQGSQARRLSACASTRVSRACNTVCVPQTTQLGLHTGRPRLRDVALNTWLHLSTAICAFWFMSVMSRTIDCMAM